MWSSLAYIVHRFRIHAVIEKNTVSDDRQTVSHMQTTEAEGDGERSTPLLF